MTADQFEAAWTSAIMEMDAVGLGMNAASLKLAYLQRLDSETRYEIIKDVRSYPRDDGGEEVRKIRTWEEAHELCRELEHLRLGCKALSSSFSATLSPSSGSNRRGRKSKKDREAAEDDSSSAPHVVNSAQMTPMPKKVCWKMRDEGNCPYGKSCRFSHDPKDLKEARERRKKEEGGRSSSVNSAKSSGSRKGGKGQGKKEKGSGKGKGKGGSRKNSPSPGSQRKGGDSGKCPKGVCKFVWEGKKCDRGANCKFAHPGNAGDWGIHEE
jgi:hypothetical protein